MLGQRASETSAVTYPDALIGREDVDRLRSHTNSLLLRGMLAAFVVTLSGVAADGIDSRADQVLEHVDAPHQPLLTLHKSCLHALRVDCSDQTDLQAELTPVQHSPASHPVCVLDHNPRTLSGASRRPAARSLTRPRILASRITRSAARSLAAVAQRCRSTAASPSLLA